MIVWHASMDYLPQGDAFIPVKLPSKSERGGLVAQTGFLKLTSTDFATSPIHRGSWILKKSLQRKNRSSCRYID